jgi:2-polyprenyl-3-methyl-5-hydroxy-6-metoxy-1,4-benzoquinol methylase
MTDLFKEKSTNWDANEMRKKMSDAIGSSILQNVQLNSQMTVIDFGAGTGLISSQVAPYVGKITAVDVSESMLEKLISKEELKGKVEILCQDITLNPIGVEYDLIMSAMAMHHVEDTDNMIQKFADHLKPGGQIALADLDSEDGGFHATPTEGVFHQGFDRGEFGRKLERFGFTEIKFLTAHVAERKNGAYPIFLALGKKS